MRVTTASAARRPSCGSGAGTGGRDRAPGTSNRSASRRFESAGKAMPITSSAG